MSVKGLPGWPKVAAFARLFDQAVTGKQIADGGASRPVALGVRFAQELEEFLSAPGRVKAAGRQAGPRRGQARSDADRRAAYASGHPDLRGPPRGSG